MKKEDQNNFKLQAAPGSSLLQPQTNISHTKGLEHGEIVQIGSRVLQSEGFYSTFDKCKPGDTLITHWDVESKAPSIQDDIYNYYFVQERDVRGYYDGKKIVPHPMYIFLKDLPPEPQHGGEYDENLKTEIKKTESGLILFADWGGSKKKLEHETQSIDDRMKSLGRMTRSEELDRELAGLQREKAKINRELKKKKVIPLKIAFANHKLNIDCGVKLKEDDIAHVFNYAAEYRCNFQLEKYKYIITLVEYIARIEQRESATA